MKSNPGIISFTDALAADDDVQWIEWPLPQFEAVNDSNSVITQANEAQARPYNLDGTGITALVYDAGTARATHNDFVRQHLHTEFVFQ